MPAYTPHTHTHSQVVGFLVVESAVQRLAPSLASPTAAAFLWENSSGQVKVSYMPIYVSCVCSYRCMYNALFLWRWITPLPKGMHACMYA